MGELEIYRRDQAHGAMSEVLFSVERDGLQVPAFAWLPTGRRHAPVVLIGHGGSGHKAIDRHHRLARQLVVGSGVACLAIDGPYHGDRAVPGDGPLDYQQRVVAEGPAAVHDRMFQDWLTGRAHPSSEPDMTTDTLSGLGYLRRISKVQLSPRLDADAPNEA